MCVQNIIIAAETCAVPLKIGNVVIAMTLYMILQETPHLACIFIMSYCVSYTGVKFNNMFSMDHAHKTFLLLDVD